MIFLDKDGRVLLTAVSQTEVFLGARPRLQQVLQTEAFCERASYDPLSGRLVTVERGGEHGEVVRVYEGDGTVVGEYSVDPDRTGRVCCSPSLSPGGQRVAFLGDLATVFWAEVGKGQEGFVWELWKLWSSVPDDTRTARFAWHGGRECCWIDESTLACACVTASWREPIFEIDVVSHRGRLLFGHGEIAGVANGRPVAVVQRQSSFELHDANSKTVLASARAGFSFPAFVGISSCGEYCAYWALTPWRRRARYYVHHLESGRRTWLRIPEDWTLQSWNERMNGTATKRETESLADSGD